MAKGKLWQAGLRDGTPVWLLEWELPQRVPRRILLAADTSDSCATERDRLKALFRVLADELQLGDSCALWIMGSRDKAVDQRIDRSQDRTELFQKLCNALPGAATRGGTWLRETRDAMLAEADRTDALPACCFLLLLSDGEVFDAETLPVSQANTPASPPLGFVRLGRRESTQLDTLMRRTAALGGNQASLRGFLASPPIRATLEPGGGSAADLVVFSGEGEIAGPMRVDGPIAVQNGQSTLRIAYVGGNRPEPRLNYLAGGLAWKASELEFNKLKQHQPQHLHRLLRLLQGNNVDWDWARLQLLADDERKQERMSCPSCHRTGLLVRRSLFCVCQVLLVSGDGTRRGEVQRLYGGGVYFRIDGERLSPCEPVSCDGNTGDDAYNVQEEDGRRLVLNLFKE